MWKEFKEFAFKGNVIDLAVGVMIGGAFGKIVSSLVNDIFMPLIGLIIGNLDIAAMFITFDGKTYENAEAAKEAGAAVLNYGQFIAAVVDFLLIALVIFIFIKLVNKLRLGKKNRGGGGQRAAEAVRLLQAGSCQRCDALSPLHFAP